ncbi:MAG TPA: hypothetical protein VL286_04370, partial [Rhizomicrobium sp.]|nr:hypothetical protein [Rhizomicrobium sp.]
MPRSVLLVASIAGWIALAGLTASGQPTAPLSGIMSTLAGDVPQGWSRNMDGSYKHAASGVLCPKDFKGFVFRRAEGPSKENPDVLGTCYYSGDSGRIGTIRIRHYAGGETGPLSDNDKLLMAKDAAPPMLLHAGIDRANGGGRATATVVRNGLLVDCSVWQPEHSTPRS